MFDMESYCRDYNIPYAFHGKQISPNWMGVPDVANKGIYDTDFHMGWNIYGGYLYSWISGKCSLLEYIRLATPHENEYDILRKYENQVAITRMNKRENATHLIYDFEPLSDAAIKYLKRRRFDPDLLTTKYNVRYGGVCGIWAYRIMFPLYHEGRIVTYQGRTIGAEVKPRYRTLSIEESLVNPKSVLFNLDNCKGDTVVLVEGVFDVFRYGDGACCSFGTVIKEEQLHRLAKYDRVVVALDTDAQDKAKVVCSKLSGMGCEVMNLDLESDRDMAEMSDIEIQQIKDMIA